jgi:hypothetical protein
MTPDQQKALDLRAQGLSRAQIATHMDKSETAVKSLLRRAMKWLNADPATQYAATVAGSHVLPHSFWLKTDTHSIYYKTPQQADTDALDHIEDRFRDIPTAQLQPVTKHGSTDRLTFYALADIHLGMRAWGEETGEDYDTDIAAARVKDGINRLVQSVPVSNEALIVAIGDSLHANDNTNMTPQSKHVLDVDTRHYRTLDIAISMFSNAVDLVAQKHPRVTFCILPGNHDRDAYLAIMFAMRERYRDCARVNIVATPMEFFVHEFGKVMIACHHGDKAKATRLVMDAADRWPEMWGRTRHRYYFTGHLHHHRSEEIGGMSWEQLRAVTAKDAYASSHAYAARAQMQAIVFDKECGEVQRHKVGFV